MGKHNNLAMAVILKGSRVLVQNRYRPEKGMVYEFPGGSMDARESPEAAAKRELFEETGITPEELLTVAEYSSVNEHGGTIYFIVLSAKASLVPAVVDPVRKQTFHWFLASEIPAADFYPADRRFIETQLVNHV